MTTLAGIAAARHIQKDHVLRQKTSQALVLMIFMLLASRSFAAVDSSHYPALDTPALKVVRATKSAILAVARAGKRLVAVGEWGIVLLSDDSGKNWRQAQRVPVSVTLTSVQFVNAKTGWATGHLGVILHTVDGGEHWTRELDGVQAAKLNLAAVEASAKGASAGDQAAPLQLLRAKRMVKDGPDSPFLCLAFRNRREGYVFGAFNLAFRTDDGGLHWTSWMPHMQNPMGLHLYAVTQIDGGLLVAGEQGMLLRSGADGATFSALPRPDHGSWFGVLKTHSGALLVYGLVGAVYRSVDGGDHWQASQSGTDASLSAGTVLDNGDIVLTTVSGNVMLSSDDGRSFHKFDVLGVPVTGVVQAPDGGLTISSLKGVREISMSIDGAVQHAN